jgi:hypothetical protein
LLSNLAIEVIDCLLDFTQIGISLKFQVDARSPAHNLWVAQRALLRSVGNVLKTKRFHGAIASQGQAHGLREAALSSHACSGQNHLRGASADYVGGWPAENDNDEGPNGNSNRCHEVTVAEKQLAHRNLLISIRHF